MIVLKKKKYIYIYSCSFYAFKNLNWNYLKILETYNSDITLSKNELFRTNSLIFYANFVTKKVNYSCAQINMFLETL